MHDGHPWQVRIPDPAHPAETLGCGVLIGPRHVITCATVVAAALGVPVEPEAPAGEVTVELALLPQPIRDRGTVAAWAPAAGRDPRWPADWEAPPGLAVLVLAHAAPAAVVPAELEDLAPADYRERAVFCLGFPPRAPGGLRIHADCADAPADGLTGLTTDHGTIDQSFTGTGAWDPIRGSLLGLVVADALPGPTGFLIPARDLLAVWPSAQVRSDHGLRARLLRRLARLDTRRGNLLVRLLAGLAFAGLAAVWWLEPDTLVTPEAATPAPADATSRIAGFVWETSGQAVPGVRVMVPTRGASALSDGFGHFDIQFQEAPGAPVELVIAAPGYRGLTEPARLGDVRVNLVLHRSTPDAAPTRDAGGVPGY